MKKILAIVLSATMIAGLSIPAMAETVDQTSVETGVDNQASGTMYTALSESNTAESNFAILSQNGIARNPEDGGWYYYEDGVIQTSFTGFGEFNDSLWYCQNGKVNFTTNGVVKGTYNGVAKWGNVSHGKLRQEETVAQNSSGWWYIGADGFVDFSANLNITTSNGCWEVTNGAAKGAYLAYTVNDEYELFITDLAAYLRLSRDFDENTNILSGGIVSYVNKLNINNELVTNLVIPDGTTEIGDFAFYGCKGLKSVKIPSSVTSIGTGAFGMYLDSSDNTYHPLSGFVVYGETGTAAETYATSNSLTFKNFVQRNGLVQESDGYWYYVNGVKQTSFTGFVDNENGTWYCQNGKVNTSVNSVVKGTYNGVSKWGNVQGGKLQAAETIARNSSGWWYIGADGFVNFSYNGIASNSNGSYKITKGQVTFSDNGVIKVGNYWYYLVRSKVTPGPTIQKNSSGWWYIDKNGKVDFTYNGIASNSNGSYRITNGKVTFSDNGVIKVGNTWYYLVKSKVTAGPTVQKNSSGWWYIDKTGKVDFTFTGIASNSNGSWYCKGGKVQFGYTGNITYNNKTYKIVNGKVQ